MTDSSTAMPSVKIYFDAEADLLEVSFTEGVGFLQETDHDAVMHRVDGEGNLLGFLVFNVGQSLVKRELMTEQIETIAQSPVGPETWHWLLWAAVERWPNLPKTDPETPRGHRLNELAGKVMSFREVDAIAWQRQLREEWDAD